MLHFPNFPLVAVLLPTSPLTSPFPAVLPPSVLPLPEPPPVIPHAKPMPPPEPPPLAALRPSRALLLRLRGGGGSSPFTPLPLSPPLLSPRPLLPLPPPPLSPPPLIMQVLPSPDNLALPIEEMEEWLALPGGGFQPLPLPLPPLPPLPLPPPPLSPPLLTPTPSSSPLPPLPPPIPPLQPIPPPPLPPPAPLPPPPPPPPPLQPSQTHLPALQPPPHASAEVQLRSIHIDTRAAAAYAFAQEHGVDQWRDVWRALSWDQRLAYTTSAHFAPAPPSTASRPIAAASRRRRRRPLTPPPPAPSQPTTRVQREGDPRKPCEPLLKRENASFGSTGISKSPPPPPPLPRLPPHLFGLLPRVKFHGLPLPSPPPAPAQPPLLPLLPLLPSLS